jgi:hypothetical protein
MKGFEITCLQTSRGTEQLETIGFFILSGKQKFRNDKFPVISCRLLILSGIPLQRIFHSCILLFKLF